MTNTTPTADGFWGGSAGYIKSEKPLAKRNEHDFYPTPDLLARVAASLLPRQFEPRRVLDPGAGNGPWGKAACERWPLADVDGVEIREDAPVQRRYSTWYRGDFLKMELDDGYDLVVGNPPYSDAQAFIEKSLMLTRDGGHVMFLLRLAFLEGKHRAETLYRHQRPQKVYVLAERPSFTPNGKTDATAYALFLWRNGSHDNTDLEFLSWKK